MASAFDSLLRSELGYVLRTLARLGVKRADTDDMAQEVWLQVHGKWTDYDEARPPRPWLFAFAFRAAANYRRLARHRESPASEAVAREPAENDTEQAVSRCEERTLLLDAIQSLDLEHSSALVLVDIDEVSPRDAAEILGIPVNTVYSRVRNARIRVKESLDLARAKGES